MIFSEATPLIAFARIGELTILERIVHHVTLPETVWGEVTAVTTRPGAEAIGQATWIAVHAVTQLPRSRTNILTQRDHEHGYGCLKTECGITPPTALPNHGTSANKLTTPVHQAKEDLNESDTSTP